MNDTDTILAALRAMRDARGAVPIVHLGTDRLGLHACVDALEMIERGIARLALPGEDDGEQCIAFDRRRRSWTLLPPSVVEQGYMDGLLAYEIPPEIRAEFACAERAAILREEFV